MLNNVFAAKAEMTPEMAAAIEHHAAMLDQYGENDPRTIDAALICMLQLPEPMFRELMEVAHARRH